MKKYIRLNGQEIVIKTREPYAAKEKVVKSKKLYSRKGRRSGRENV